VVKQKHLQLYRICYKLLKDKDPPLCLNIQLSVRWRFLVSFMCLPVYPQRNRWCGLPELVWMQLWRLTLHAWHTIQYTLHSSLLFNVISGILLSTFLRLCTIMTRGSVNWLTKLTEGRNFCVFKRGKGQISCSDWEWNPTVKLTETWCTSYTVMVQNYVKIVI